LDTLPLEHPDAKSARALIDEAHQRGSAKGPDKLPSRARMALVLRYYSDMS